VANPTGSCRRSPVTGPAQTVVNTRRAVNNPQWPSLTDSAASIDATLKDIAGTVNAVASGLHFIGRRGVAVPPIRLLPPQAARGGELAVGGPGVGKIPG
jgi:hypothetical protein